jgi:hypothetical protein
VPVTQRLDIAFASQLRKMGLMLSTTLSRKHSTTWRQESYPTNERMVAEADNDGKKQAEFEHVH